MLFSRREPLSLGKKLRVAVWPTTSFGRSVRYVAKRILRLSATPHAVAAGVAAGVFSAFTPFLGVHMAIAIAIAWLLSGNMAAAALATFSGNPVTYPPIWAATYALGRFILGQEGEAGEHGRLAELENAGWFSSGVSGFAQAVESLWEPLLKPMTVGSVPLGVAAAIVAYALTRGAMVRVNESRRIARLAASNAAGANPIPGEPAGG